MLCVDLICLIPVNDVLREGILHLWVDLESMRSTNSTWPHTVGAQRPRHLHQRSGGKFCRFGVRVGMLLLRLASHDKV